MIRRVPFALVLVCLVSACAPAPVPTQTLVIPTLTALPVTFTPTSSQTATAAATEMPAGQVRAGASGTPTIPAPPAETAPPLTAASVEYDRSPRALLIEADVTTDETASLRDMHVPLWRLYGDGMVVFAGERTPLSSGLDAVVRVGHLSSAEVQNLLAYLNRAGFFTLGNSYQPRSASADAQTAHISIYLNKVKTVVVREPNSDASPQIFTNAFKRITQTVPADAQAFVPPDAYLQTTDAGALGSLGARERLTDWAIPGVRLADAVGGSTITGIAQTLVGAIVSNNPATLFREGSRAWRVRFAPNLPRAAHLSDWVGIILAAPREFDGRTFEVVGYYRGANLFGEAGGNPPVTLSDWVVADDTGAVYVAGVSPPGLYPFARSDAWSVLRVTARVVYVRLGTSYLEARRVEVLERSAPTPTPTLTISSTATITATRTFTATPSTAAARTVTPNVGGGTPYSPTAIRAP